MPKLLRKGIVSGWKKLIKLGKPFTLSKSDDSGNSSWDEDSESCLDGTPSTAFELATLIREAIPGTSVQTLNVVLAALNFQKNIKGKPPTPSDADVQDRLKNGVPAPIESGGPMDWSRLHTAFPSEMLKNAEDGAEVLEINSGGQVIFCLLKPKPGGKEKREGVAIIKFGASRLAMQAEQFANELTRHLDISAPKCRLVRKEGDTAEEWKHAKESAKAIGSRGECLLNDMNEHACFLLMEYIPGRPLRDSPEALLKESRSKTLQEVGAVFLLDMLLGNPDRLPSPALGWRGNPDNLLYGQSGPHQGCVVTIDSCIPRQPPQAATSQEDEAVQRICELVLNDSGVAREVLKGALALDDRRAALVSQEECQEASFQNGLRTCLEKVLKIQGLLEMMLDKTNTWISEVLDDIGSIPDATKKDLSQLGKSNSKARSVKKDNMTMKIRKIGQKANKKDAVLKARIGHWKKVMRSREEELKKAVLEWQERRGVERCLTTGFLDGTHPIVDAYELKVRLMHVMRRLKFIVSAAQTAKPIEICDYLFVGSAVTSQACHTLKHKGITHIVNSTQDVEFPEEKWGFTGIRVSIRDTEDQDIGSHFDEVHEFIVSAKEKGGRVLVHCHEGKSRSVSLILAHLMKSNNWTLKAAMDHVKLHRPEASPNSGFMDRLLVLDEQMHGARSMVVKSRKPKAKLCPLCGQSVGISEKSLMVHLKTKHGT
ncbi:hypothetical protein BSKO_07314 [Bryopsis sp. KO-2023]|nr:hypothetical protein BSKO_07314 [Bryopsis sp. KO-2023]